mmetsp:Transcript_7656/g.31087  ORF Transcript_7656/g.31087 Transcript_7656/m.31087 type:complete len:246 (+) Transcript_7656:300-1037(+)
MEMSPSSVGTRTLPPSAAVGKGTDASTCTSSPSRSNVGSGRTRTCTRRSPARPCPVLGGPPIPLICSRTPLPTPAGMSSSTCLTPPVCLPAASTSGRLMVRRRPLAASRRLTSTSTCTVAPSSRRIPPMPPPNAPPPKNSRMMSSMSTRPPPKPPKPCAPPPPKPWAPPARKPPSSYARGSPPAASYSRRLAGSFRQSYARCTSWKRAAASASPPLASGWYFLASAWYAFLMAAASAPRGTPSSS